MGLGRLRFRGGLVLSVAALIACSSDPPDPVRQSAGSPASLLLLTLDTTRADRLEPYGYPDGETPSLAALARQGTLFERAYAATPVTLPSHATMFSGLDPTQHGVRNNGQPLAAGQGPLLAELLRDAGWRTAAFVSAAVLDRRFGLARGFEVYDDDLSSGAPREARLFAERPARATVAAAAAWLDRLGEGERFFLWVHLFEPHAAYRPPPPFAVRFAERPYDGEIAVMDHEIGRLLAHRRLAPGEAVVMALADHGESLGEHGEETHAMLAYDATLRIPWIVRLPGGAGGRRIAEPVAQVDLLPTLADLLELPAPPVTTGISLAPALRGAAELPAERPLYAESLVPYFTYGWAPIHVWRRGGWKLLRGAGAELYDLAADPGELDDLAADQPQRTRRLQRELETALAQVVAPPASANGDRGLAARLRSLGYLAGGGDAARRESRPDPAELIGAHLAFERAAHLFHRRRLEEAIPGLESVLRRDPDNLAALTLLAQALADAGRVDEALARAERAVGLAPELADPRVTLGIVRARRGELEAAVAELGQAVELEPAALEAHLELALALFRSGRHEEGADGLRRVLAVDPHDPRAAIALAEQVELAAGRVTAAERSLREVLAREPFQVEGWRALGRLLERDGRFDEALATYRRGLEEVPGDGLLHARLGLLLARQGRDGEAEASLRRAAELLRPGSAAVHNALAGIHLRRADWTGAEREARRALATDPAAAPAWNNLAAALEEQGDRGGALSAYGEALAVDPGFWQAELNRALLLAAGGRYRDAAAGFERVTRRVPDHGGAHFELGRLQLGPLGELAAGALHLRLAIAADPTHPRAAEARRLLVAAGLEVSP